MLTAKAGLLLALGALTLFFVVSWFAALRDSKPGTPSAWELAIGFITNFLDTLGIGSFATTTSFYKLKGLVPDQLIPGTLNVGHTLPSVTEAFIYIAIIEVDLPTLVLMILASVLGAWLGAGVVSRWPRRNIQIGMGFCLLGAAALMLMTQLKLFPAGGDTLGLSGVLLGIGLVGNFVLGALMSLGIGLYAPCLILVSLLGMAPTTAFPIMMGSCAFLMPVASARFVKTGRYHPRAALGLTLGGIPAVLVAAFIVKSLPLSAVRWLVVLVVVYTASMMLRSALTERTASTPGPSPSV